MVVTVLGIIIIFNLEYENAVVSIVSTSSGISIISKFEQNANKERKFQRCPFNVGKPFFRWGYVILSQNKSDLVVF